MAGEEKQRIPGSYVMVLWAIYRGFNTPAKLTIGNGIELRSLVVLLQRLHKDRYLCRTERRPGIIKLELLEKGRQALQDMGIIDEENEDTDGIEDEGYAEEVR
jgi:hypothetical protein